MCACSVTSLVDTGICDSKSGLRSQSSSEHLPEEKELIAQLRKLANHVRPRSVTIIHVPSPAVPKISAAKSRRNVQNFIDACRKLGVSEDSEVQKHGSQILRKMLKQAGDLICHPQHILEDEGLTKVARMVQALTETAAQGPSSS
ncbi:UNVERIFIED_CONTAM: hypothetical protein FKN15_006145 [Acipenser sinensis]